MAKPRARTIQQRFGFMDEDLTTPAHDHIMLWLTENIDIVLSHFINRSSDWTNEDQLRQLLQDASNWRREKLSKRVENGKERVERASQDFKKHYKNDPDKPLDKYWKDRAGEAVIEYEQAVSELAMFEEWLDNFSIGDSPDVPGLSELVETEWEVPVTTGRDNKYIVGFIDLRAWLTRPILAIKGLSSDDWLYAPDGHKYPRRFDWRDISWEIKEGRTYTFNFEIKSVIKSLGELIRQIRMYQEYTKGTFVVISPDDRFKDAIEKQGIKFYHFQS